MAKVKHPSELSSITMRIGTGDYSIIRERAEKFNVTMAEALHSFLQQTDKAFVSDVSPAQIPMPLLSDLSSKIDNLLLQNRRLESRLVEQQGNLVPNYDQCKALIDGMTFDTWESVGDEHGFTKRFTDKIQQLESQIATIRKILAQEVKGEATARLIIDQVHKEAWKNVVFKIAVSEPKYIGHASDGTILQSKNAET